MLQQQKHGSCKQGGLKESFVRIVVLLMSMPTRSIALCLTVAVIAVSALAPEPALLWNVPSWGQDSSPEDDGGRQEDGREEDVGTAVGAGGNGLPVLQPGQQVLHLMALLLQPLAVREPLGAVPPGRDAGHHALLQHHGANPVAVVPLISNQHARLRKIPQQELSTGEVAAWPFAEEKADRAPFPSHTTGRLLVRPLWCDPSSAGRRPLFQAGGGAVGFDAGGIDHQHLFWRCTGFCLCVSGSGQLGEDQLENSFLPPAAEAVGEGFVGFMGGWASTRA